MRRAPFAVCTALFFAQATIVVPSAVSAQHAKTSQAATAAQGTVAAKPPNIVVILADDMGYGDPQCYNPASKIKTPHIDRLAREGMRFVDAHAAGSVCVPSRYGLLTGRYPCRARLFGTQAVQDVIIADDEVDACVACYENAGYATAMVGKWHLGFDNGRKLDYTALSGGPCDRGFDSYFGIPASLDIPPYYYIRDRAALAAPTQRVEASNTDGWTRIQGAFWRKGGVAPGFKHQEVLPRFRDEAVRVIDTHARERKDKPLFLYLALPAPHTPWLPAERYRGRSAAGMYGDFVMQVDDLVGDVAKALDRNGLGENTLLLFSSDNGPVWYPQDERKFGHHSTGVMRGMKGDAWEGGHRVPFVVRWPARVKAGTTSAQTLCFTDLLATCAEAAQSELPKGAGEDSISFLPILEGRKPATKRTTTILKANASVVREGRWKLIDHLGSGGFSRPRRGQVQAGGPRGQLYDLDADPSETTNLWTEQPQVVARLLRHRARLEQPNVIVILADDMGYGDSSVYDGWIKMPGLERMAREGLKLTDFHTSGTVCSPTRAGLLTGRYQQRAGLDMVVNADPKKAAHHRGLQDVEWTLAEAMKGAGYRTALFGKWHLGYKKEFNPTRHGFDEFRGFVSGNIDYHSRYDRMGTHDWWHGDKRVEDEGYLTHRLTEHAVDFVAKNRDRPFFLYVAHGAPHTPIQGPKSPILRGPNKARRAPRNADRGVRGRQAKRDATTREMMKALDESVSAILDAVRKNGIAGRTLVLFFSDNGGARHMRNTPLRGGKGSVWEGGHRVPALAWWPGTIRRGRVSDQLCSSLDVMPTMLALAGVDAREERKLDGVDLGPLLRGQELGPRQLFWPGAMRDGPWKLIARRRQRLLFDLRNDIGEKRDLRAEHPERFAKMAAALAAWRKDVETNATKQPR